MKKLTALFFLIFSFSFVHAELYDYSRRVEFGMHGDFNFSQNVFAISELMVEKLIFDFRKMNSRLDEDGWIFDTNYNTGMEFSINLKNGFRLTFVNDFYGNFEFSTGKGLFNFLAEGTSRNGDFGTTMKISGQSFIQSGVGIRTKIKDFGVQIIPAMYMPLYYIPNSTVKVNMYSSDEEKLMLHAFVDKDDYVEIYSNFDMSKAFDDDFSFLGAGDLVSSITDDAIELIKGTGVNISALVDRKLTQTLDGGIYTSFSIIPGRLHYVNKTKIGVDAWVKQMLEDFTSTSKEEDSPSQDEEPKNSGHDFNHEGDDNFGFDYDYKFCGSEKDLYKVSTPFKLGVDFAWRPFGSWCIFRPKFGLAVKNPFGSDYNSEQSFYTEYSLGIETRLVKNIFGFSFTSDYLDKVYSQDFAFKLNTHLMELAFHFASSGADFEKTWNLSGFKFGMALKVGI